MTADSKPVAVIAGVGPGNGTALARRFASGGYAIALLARKPQSYSELVAEIAGAKGYDCDMGDPSSIEAAFAAIREGFGEVHTLLYNAGSGVFKPFSETTAAEFTEAWRVNALGAFVTAKQVLPAMLSAKRGNIVFIGATASRRGGKITSAFAPAKAAQRSLAESLARTAWPSGVHVSTIVIDGVIDTARMREMIGERPDEFFIKADGIASIAWSLCHQDRSAWSFEVEARPFGENW